MAYSRRQWGKSHASEYRQGLKKRIALICHHPKAYVERPEIGEGYRVVRYKGNYLVYRINEVERVIEIMGFPSIHQNDLQG